MGGWVGGWVGEWIEEEMAGWENGGTGGWVDGWVDDGLPTFQDRAGFLRVKGRELDIELLLQAFHHRNAFPRRREIDGQLSAPGTLGVVGDDVACLFGRVGGGWVGGWRNELYCCMDSYHQ